VTTTQLAADLNIKKSDAHTTFSGDNTANTWRVTCDSGYIIGLSEVTQLLYGTIVALDAARNSAKLQYRNNGTLVSAQSGGSWQYFTNGTTPGNIRSQSISGCLSSSV